MDMINRVAPMGAEPAPMMDNMRATALPPGAMIQPSAPPVGVSAPLNAPAAQNNFGGGPSDPSFYGR